VPRAELRAPFESSAEDASYRRIDEKLYSHFANRSFACRLSDESKPFERPSVRRGILAAREWDSKEVRRLCI
jgi:hypothetical protein